MTAISMKWLDTEDAEELFEFAAPIFRATYGDLDPEGVERYLQNTLSPGNIRDLIRNGRRYAYIISNGENVGFIGFDMKDGILFLDKLYFRPEYRRMGFGTATIDFLKDLAESEGLRILDLHVADSNHNAWKFYETLGFKASGPVKDYPGLTLMVLDI